MPGQEVYTVSSLIAQMKHMLESSYRNIWVEGEISSLSRPASGHLYFSLKEESTLIRCAFFRNRQSGSAPPIEGMQVLLRGQVSIYQNRGDLQLIVHYLEPAGEGILRRQFEILKRKLQSEGLFDPAHKKPLPIYPRTIGVITSDSGAALHDILVTLRRRYPPATVIIHPVPVQGTEAPDAIAEMLDQAPRHSDIDVLILARGGGSLEDLQAFNEERVARAIHRCTLPIVSGVGHETDLTIADMVADHRAPTPTGAAELVTPVIGSVLLQVQRQQENLIHQMVRCVNDLEQRIDHATSGLVHPSERLQRHRLQLESLMYRSLNIARLSLSHHQRIISERQNSVRRHDPANRLRLYRERHQILNERLKRATERKVSDCGHSLKSQISALSLLGPSQTLARGYAVLRNQQKQVINSVSLATAGDRLSALLADGSLSVTVHED